jgi:uroporphyrinogen-III synthase
MRVVVTRPASTAAEWLDALRARGFDAVSLPLIEIRPAADAAKLREAWQRIDAYRAAMFVSANAVAGFFDARPAAAAFTPRAWATGSGTRDALIAAGSPVERIDMPAADAAQFDSEALWQVVQPQCRPRDRVLIVRGGEGRDWLEQRLVHAGVAVDTVSAYERRAPAWTPEQRELAAGAATQTWIFSSSQAIAHLREGMPGQDWGEARAVATHPRIAQAARDAGFRVVCESRPPIAEVIAALESLG